MTKLVKVGRLALRRKGENWNAYYAMPDTMDGAIPIGSIKLRFVLDNPERKQVFMDLMRDAVGDLLQELTGKKAEWPDGPQSAPESERAGHS